jgi:predicted SnoaL-like aldol condensation-catalyzing enzyme
MKTTHMNALVKGLSAATLAAMTACATVPQDKDTLSNKDKAVALIESIESGDPEPVGYINADKYIQHNLAIADGLQGFGEAMAQLPANSAKARVVRAFEDDNYVVIHSEYNFFGPKAGFDVFRFENGKIVEHWDNLQAIAPLNPSGRSQFDGTTVITDRNKTTENKQLVNDFVNSILIKGELDKIDQFIGPNDADYLQHNPAVADGLSGLSSALQALAEQGMPMQFSQNHKILGEGNFVLAISEGQFLNQHVAFYDLFRVENDKIVEHWDTIETIPARQDWKNNNGKFGFK